MGSWETLIFMLLDTLMQKSKAFWWVPHYTSPHHPVEISVALVAHGLFKLSDLARIENCLDIAM